MKQINRIIIGLAIGTGWTVVALAQGQKDWQAPDIGKLPDDKYGQMVRQGKALMEQTYKHIGPEVKDASKRFSGNNLACVSCHMDAGSRKFGNPWVGTFVSFPQYRGREDAVSTTEERINGCMERSMNGRKLPLESAEMKAMLSYLHFLSTGIPVGAKLEGGGTLKLKPLARAADPVAGKQVYATTCAACHGENGQGMRRGKVGDADGYQFPPVWGADSYNNGAGMARVTLAAGFIKGNMPSGITHTTAVLTDEQAFDVAAYVNSQPRPVKLNLDADFPARKNKPVDAAFAPYTPGFSPEQHKYGPWKAISEAREKGIYPAK
ncbi:MAG: c-type cytochrome [Burkholderiales bacterium]|nr:c-type cytochrome [Burkholderiales bacterium]